MINIPTFDTNDISELREYKKQKEILTHLNKKFFSNVNLSPDEELAILWLVSNNNTFSKNIISAFERAFNSRNH